MKKQPITLSQEVKRMACNILDPHHRGAFVRTMFAAELEQHNYKNRRRAQDSAGSETSKDGGSND